ncbi:MAG: hypothetical protein QM706_20970 [Nitrospira sp.]
MDTYFTLTGAGGYPAPPGFIDGTISYAGGSAALVGKNIGISHILDNLAGASGPELVCEKCVLTFSTGPFAGTVPHEGTPDGYSFSGGGSLQIIGGVKSQDGNVSLPANTVLLTAVPTGASTLIENGPLPVLPEVMLEFKNVVLHPKLRSLFSFPAGDFTGQLLIASGDTASLNNPPNPFVLSKFVGTHFFEPSYVLVMTDTNQAVSLQKG